MIDPFFVELLPNLAEGEWEVCDPHGAYGTTHVLFTPEGNCIALYWDGNLVQRVREDLWHRGDEEAVLCAARLIMGWEKWTEGDRHEKESQ